MLARRPSASQRRTTTTQPPAVSPVVELKSEWSDSSTNDVHRKPKRSAPKAPDAPRQPSLSQTSAANLSVASSRSFRSVSAADHLSPLTTRRHQQPSIAESTNENDDNALADELDYINVSPPSPAANQLSFAARSDKASRILGIQHRRSMEPIPASTRTSIVSTRSAREAPPIQSFTPTLPLTSLYVVSGLPKAPHTWTLADPDSVLGLAHSEGAVSRWWRAEVLGSTVSPGAGGGKKKKRAKGDTEILKGAGALSKQEVGKMLSKALKLSFTREVEIIASTLQPASTVHTFSFALPAPSTPLAPSASGLLRSSVLSTGTGASERPLSNATSLFPYQDPFAGGRPSSSFLGPPNVFPPGSAGNSRVPAGAGAGAAPEPGSTVTYHGVCLTVWSHADAERSTAIRRTLEASRSRKESAQSLAAARLKSLRAEAKGTGAGAGGTDPALQARRSAKRGARGPWGGHAQTDGETDMDAETDGAMSESDFEVASTANGHNPGESTLFLPGDTVFWLPYALTLVSRHPIYDLMRDYLTLSWARFSKDVQSHTLQISKILSHPAPRAGDLIKLDASATVKGADPAAASADTSLEVIARFPGGLDFGRGLVDINFTMWPLFKALNIDNILTICEIALSPTGRILFFSRHPAMLGIAVSTIKYLVELRGWNGIALQAVHSRDAKIYIDDPGPWIMGLATEARYCARPPPEVCVVDLDINYLSCASPPSGVVSSKQQRDRYRQRLLVAFEPHYHPDHSVPSEFKEAFPAGRFRPVCKIQAKRGASSAAVADTIKPPEWWHSTRIIQAFDAVLHDKMKPPSLLKRISSFGVARRPPQLSAAEQLIQHSIRKRATAFVDARDDLETKIGRLSRRLNFLMTESDLWRDKFVTFEQYAEKLSVEANELRSKIGREQRETKRLSGLVTMTAVEKSKLQNQLKETEYAHKEALIELEKMRETMDSMEQEREEMVAEVEAQIEKALASMAVGVDDSDYDDSRPASRVSSRRPSDAGGAHPKQLRSYGTESTLAESYDALMMKEEAQAKLELAKAALIEEEEEAAADADVDVDSAAEAPPLSPSKKNVKRFSAEAPREQDGMAAVDAGISERSDKIAQKVLQIQRKLENAFVSESAASQQQQQRGQESEESDEGQQSVTVRHTRPPRGTKLVGKPPRAADRPRGNTVSSTRSTRSTRSRPSTADTASHDGHDTPRAAAAAEDRMDVPRSSTELEARTPTKASFLPGDIPDSQSDDERPPTHGTALRKIASGASLGASPPASAALPVTPALTAALTGTTDDSDTDFQSAYSTSPRGSYGSFEDAPPKEAFDDGADEGTPVPGAFDAAPAPAYQYQARPRLLSEAPTLMGVDNQPSPTLSEDTVVSRGRGVGPVRPVV